MTFIPRKFRLTEKYRQPWRTEMKYVFFQYERIKIYIPNFPVTQNIHSRQTFKFQKHLSDYSWINKKLILGISRLHVISNNINFISGCFKFYIQIEDLKPKPLKVISNKIRFLKENIIAYSHIVDLTKFSTLYLHKFSCSVKIK